MAVKAMPDGYHRVTPYLVVPGVATRLDCLTQAALHQKSGHKNNSFVNQSYPSLKKA
jgi:hypothetical protein